MKRIIYYLLSCVFGNKKHSKVKPLGEVYKNEIWKRNSNLNLKKLL